MMWPSQNFLLYNETKWISKFFVKNEKKINKLVLKYHIYIVQPLILHFEVFFLKIPMVKNFSVGGGGVPLPCGGSISPLCTKIMHDLTIANINKCFEFQKDWLKIIRTRYNCTQFHLIPLWMKITLKITPWDATN